MRHSFVLARFPAPSPSPTWRRPSRACRHPTPQTKPHAHKKTGRYSSARGLNFKVMSPATVTLHPQLKPCNSTGHGTSSAVHQPEGSRLSAGPGNRADKVAKGSVCTAYSGLEADETIIGYCSRFLACVNWVLSTFASSWNAGVLEYLWPASLRPAKTMSAAIVVPHIANADYEPILEQGRQMVVT